MSVQTQSVKIMSVIAIAMLAAGSFKLLSDKHSLGSSDHALSNHHASVLKEGGQSTFAAIIEVVSVFEADNKTDWEQVDIDGLRSHLLDMNDLVINTDAVTQVEGEDQIRYDIIANGGNDSLGAIHRMVQAHSRFIEQSRGWKINPVINDKGATVTITVDSHSDLVRLKALGFYGFMSLDSHHQAHHYQIAMGVGH